MMLKRFSILVLVITTLMGVSSIVYAQGIDPLEQWKATTTPFSAITTRSHAKNIYVPFSTATTSKVYSTTFCINNVTPDCITAWPSGGSGGNWFTPATGYNSTSTVIGFLAGLFSNSSTTINGTFRLPSLSDGGLAVFGGLVSSGATTTAGTGLTYSGNAFNVNTSQNISTLSNLTGNGFVKTSGGTGALSIDTNTYLTGNQTITLSGDVTGSGATTIVTSISPTTRDWTLFSPTILQPTTTPMGIYVQNSTSTITNLSVVNSTSTNATTTNLFSTTASSTNLFGQSINGFGLSACTGTNALTWTGGSFTCTAQPQGTVTSIATNNGITGGTITTTGTIGLATINAGVLGSPTNATVPTSQATSTLYGVGTGGQVLGWSNTANGIAWVATSSGGSGTVGTGAIGQVPYYAANGTDLTATSTVYIATTTFVGIGTQLPLSKLEINGNLLFSSTTGGASRTLGVAQASSGTVPNVFTISNAAGFANTVNGSANGGALTVSAGAGGVGTGNASATGGLLTLSGGAGAQTGSPGGAGGAVAITGGAAAGSSSGAAGGAISLTGGAGAGSNSAAGGGLTFTGGAAAGSGSNGGAFTVTTGAGAGTGLGGAVSISVGASGSNAAGGTVTITSGTGVNSGAGGLTTISSGNGGSSSGAGGAITLNAGNGVGSGAAGGIASLFGGSGGSGNSSGGDVYLYGGAKAGSGTDGDVLLTYTGSAFRGFVGIGTSSPYAPLSVVGGRGVVAQLFHATSTIATSTIAGGLNVGSTTALQYDFSTGATTINNLITGPLSFDNDAGIVSWADLPLTASGAALNSIQSYSASLNGTSTLTVFGRASGVGTIIASSSSVGISSTTPWAALSVNNVADQHGFAVGSSTATVFLVDKFRRVGVASSSPWRTFSVSGTGAWTGLTAAGATGNSLCLDSTSKEVLENAASSCLVSSLRYKENIKNILSDSLQKIMKLRPVTYNYKTDAKKQTHVGLIAEEVAKVIPSATTYNSKGQAQSLEYSEITATLVHAFQSIVAKVTGLEKRLDAQEARIKALEAKLK